MNLMPVGRLPWLVLLALVGVTVVVAIAAMVSGLLPPRSWGAMVLPLYFGTLLLVLALAYIASGNTLMHHYRTSTIQRESSPVAFWCVVCVQLGIAAVLLIFGFMHWHPT